MYAETISLLLPKIKPSDFGASTVISRKSMSLYHQMNKLWLSVHIQVYLYFHEVLNQENLEYLILKELKSVKYTRSSIYLYVN